MAITARFSSATHAPNETPPLRWTAFLFRLPGASGRARTALWRMLNELGALKLGQGTWAIPHRGGKAPDLDRAFQHVRAAGGEAWAREVGDRDDDDLRLQRRLQDACEHVWDGFFNDVDRLAYDAAIDPQAATDRLTALRTDFGRLLARDLIRSSASARAEHRLDELAEIVQQVPAPEDPSHDTDTPTDDAGGTTRATTSTTPTRRHTIGTPTVVELADDRVRIVMQVTPPVSAAWEQSFTDFEQFAYAPDPDRPPLRHNTFTTITSADQVVAAQDSVRERLARFGSFERP